MCHDILRREEKQNVGDHGKPPQPPTPTRIYMECMLPFDAI